MTKQTKKDIKTSKVTRKVFLKLINIKRNKSNIYKKIQNNLKWFKAAYLGCAYGWKNIYEYKDININGKEGNFKQFIGITSIEELKNNLAKYISSDKFEKFKESPIIESITDNIEENNGIVYCNFKNQEKLEEPIFYNEKISNINKDIITVELDYGYKIKDKNKIDLKQKIQLTIRYNKNNKSYLITDWIVENKN